jgi:hypothetical protein
MSHSKKEAFEAQVQRTDHIFDVGVERGRGVITDKSLLGRTSVVQGHDPETEMEMIKFHVILFGVDTTPLGVLGVWACK